VKKVLPKLTLDDPNIAQGLQDVIEVLVQMLSYGDEQAIRVAVSAVYKLASLEGDVVAVAPHILMPKLLPLLSHRDYDTSRRIRRLVVEC
jgi:aspartate carbamoyltransferase catalytic subunit